MPKVIGFMLSFVNPVFILLFVLKMAANIKKDCSDHLLGTLLATRIRWLVISLQQQTMKGRGQKHHHNHIIVAIIPSWILLAILLCCILGSIASLDNLLHKT